MSFEERTGDPWKTHGEPTASHGSLQPGPTSAASLFFSLAFQSSSLAKPRTEIAGLGLGHPRAPPPGFPSTGRLFGTGHVLGVLPTTPAELPELLQPGSPVAPLAFPSRELLLLLPRGAFRPAAEPLRRGPRSHMISSPPPPFPAAPRARPASLLLAKAEKRNVNRWGKGTRQFPGHSEGTGPPSQGCPLRHGAGVWRPQRLLGFALGFLI